MEIEFKAESVDFLEAMDGEITQVHFSENDNDDDYNPKYCSLTLSVNCEFPPANLHAQFDNAKDTRGDEKVTGDSVDESRIVLWLKSGKKVTIKYCIEKNIINKLSTLLVKQVGEPKKL